MVKRVTAVGLLLALLLVMCSVTAQEPVNQSTLRALLIGSDRFAHHPDIHPAARNNISHLTQALGQDVRGYQSIRVSLNEAHSFESFSTLSAESFWGADENDISLIYLTTHGLYSLDQDPMDFAMVLSDGENDYHLTAAQLYQATRDIPGMKILVIDTCNSGALIDRGLSGEGQGSLFHGDQYKVITSSGGSEPSYFWTSGNGQYHGGGYFADALMLGISPQGNYAADTVRDGRITLSELHQFMLQNYGVATPQVYPADDQTTILSYDVSARAADPSLITNLSLEQGSFGAGEQQLEFSYTLNRAARMHYQLIYQENESWQFSDAQIMQEVDDKPGRKSRALHIQLDDPAMSGYALLYLVTVDADNAMPHAQSLLMAEPLQGDPMLKVTPAMEAFSPLEGQELPLLIEHAFPLRMSVLVVDKDENTVKVLAGDAPTRPSHLPNDSQMLYWSGRGQDGSFVPPGIYRVLVTATIGNQRYQVGSAEVELK